VEDLIDENESEGLPGGVTGVVEDAESSVADGGTAVEEGGDFRSVSVFEGAWVCSAF